MRREVTPDLAKLVAQTAIGQTLHLHFGVSDELPSPFHRLLERMDRQDAPRVAARYPAKRVPVENSAASTISTDGVIGQCGKPAGIISGDERWRRAAALFARAEEARTAADTMQAPGTRESMFRARETRQYE
jgi:hypothetical protein